MTDLRVISFTPKAKEPEPAEPDNAVIIKTLEELLAEAKEGKMRGLIAITDSDKDYGYVRCGTAGVGNLTHAIGMVTGYQHRLCSKLS